MNEPNTTLALHRQILWDRMIAVVEEQAQTIIRTAFGTAAREAGDVSAGMFLPDGRMLAQAVTGTPGHVNSMAESVRHFLQEYPADSMREGDIYLTNDPWKATGHLWDITVVTPVFLDDKLVALTASTTHVVDIGGIGIGPDSTSIYLEGLFLPILQVASGGKINDAVMRILRANVREPVQVEGDVYALIVCNEVAARRQVEMMREYDLADLEDLGRHILEQSRSAMLKATAEWPSGTWHNEMMLDGYEEPIRLVASLTLGPDGIDVDLAGCSPAVQRAINVPKSYTDAYTTFGLRCIIGPNVPNNAGSLGVIRITAPEGCIVNAQHPSAVSARNIVGQMMPDLMFGCLRQARAGEVPAEGASTLWNIRLAGGQPIPGADPAEFLRSRPFTQVAFTTGGTGARPRLDGLSTTSFPSGVRNTAVEIVEAMSPLLFWSKEYRPDSGGAGEHRGGLGQRVEISHSEGAPMLFGATFDRVHHPARGNDDGHDGACGVVRLASGKVLAGKGRQLIPAGDRLIVETPGGGGIGDPRSRPLEKVAADLRNGYISESHARAKYGWQS